MDDEDAKDDPFTLGAGDVSRILGAGDVSRFKTNTKPRIGKACKPIAEFTSLGWTIMTA